MHFLDVLWGGAQSANLLSRYSQHCVGRRSFAVCYQNRYSMLHSLVA